MEEAGREAADAVRLLVLCSRPVGETDLRNLNRIPRIADMKMSTSASSTSITRRGTSTNGVDGAHAAASEQDGHRRLTIDVAGENDRGRDCKETRRFQRVSRSG